MALRERFVPIALGAAGLDTETNEKTVPIGSFTTLENAVFTERVSITKRFGTSLLNREIANPVAYSRVSGGLGISSRDDGQALVMLSSNDDILEYNEQTSTWVKRGDWPMFNHELSSLPRESVECWDTTTCTSGNVQLWAWEDARGGVYARLRDTQTGVTYGNAFRIGGNLGRQPTALTVGHNFHVYYTSNNTMNVAVINPANPTAQSASLVQLHPSISTTTWGYGVCTNGYWTTARIAIPITGKTYVAVVREDGNIGASGSSPWPNPINLDTTTTPPSIAASNDGQIIAITGITTDAVLKSVLLNANTFTSASSIIMDSSPFILSPVYKSIVNVGSCFSNFMSQSNGVPYYELLTFSTMSSSIASDRNIRVARAYTTGTVAPTGIFYGYYSGSLIRHTEIASAPFAVNNNVFFWGTRRSAAQTTDYLIRDDGMVCGVSRYSTASPIVSGVIGHVDVRNVGGQITCRRGVTSVDQLPLPGTSGSTYSGKHPEMLTLQYHVSSSWKPVDVGGILYMPGGFLGRFDGNSVTENGFLYQVEGLSGSVGSSSLGAGQGILQSGSVFATGPLATASFVYSVIPVAYDAMGNEERGGYVSTLVLSLTGAIGSVQNTASLSWPSITHTLRNGDRAPDIRFKVFRTGYVSGVPGVTRQRIDNPSYPILNSTASDYITFNDTFPEVTRAAGEVDYTQIERMANPTSAITTLTPSADRLFAAGVPNRPDAILASKLRLGGAIEFSDGDEISVDSAGGPLTALASMDGNLIAFKRARLFGANAYSGPDNSLTSTDPWPLTQLITSDVGAPAPAVLVSVAGQTDQGIIFWSERGARIIDRSNTVRNDGWQIAKFKGLTPVGGTQPEATEDARIYTAEGTTLVLNTRFDRWSTFPDQVAVGATTWKGNPTYLGPDGRCWTENTGSFLDNGRAYSMVIETGWIPLADSIQGLARVRQLYVIGDDYSPHTLRVEMAFDDRDDYLRKKEFVSNSALQVLQYGGLDNVSSLTGTLVTSGSRAYLNLVNTNLGSFDEVIRARLTGTEGNSYQFATLDMASSAYATGSLTTVSGLTTFRYQGNVTTNDNFVALFPTPTLEVASGTFIGSSVITSADSGITSNFAGGYTGSFVPAYAESSYNSGSYGGYDPVYQYRIDLPIQRTQELRLRFSDHDQSGNGRSYSLAELKLRVATESGKPRLPTRKIG